MDTTKVRYLLAHDSDFKVRALLALCEENFRLISTYGDQKLFSDWDDQILCSFGDQFRNRGFLSPKQMALLDKKLPRYDKELAKLLSEHETKEPEEVTPPDDEEGPVEWITKAREEKGEPTGEDWDGMMTAAAEVKSEIDAVLSDPEPPELLEPDAIEHLKAFVTSHETIDGIKGKYDLKVDESKIRILIANERGYRVVLKFDTLDLLHVALNGILTSLEDGSFDEVFNVLRGG